MSDSDDFEKLLESVADGDSIDWDALERAAPDEPARLLIHELRLISEVAEVHRSHIDQVILNDESPGSGRPTATPTPRNFPPSEHVGQPREPVAGGHEVWGHLLLVRKIGEGSYGEVYQAHDTWLDHPVALKLLKREAEGRVPPSDLLHEARKLARVRHTNVVTVHGADRHDGRVGFWMDFIDGETLAARVARGRLSAGEAVSIGQEVCRALAAVHRASIIHRDVKAQNVMRANDGGRIILMDFGAGQFMASSSLGKRAQGTPLYLSPELLLTGEADVRSDIYATGVLLYHLVTGRFPVEESSLPALREAHARGERRRLRDERPDLPDSFIRIVERAIDPDPSKRFSSAGEMDAVLTGEPHSIVVSRAPATGAWDYVRWAAIGAAAVGTLAGVLGFIAARFFEVVFRIEPDFSTDLRGILVLGWHALFPFLVFWTIGAAGFALLSVLDFLVPAPVVRLWKRMSARVQSNPRAIAAAIFLLGASLLGAITWKFWGIFQVLVALSDDPQLPSSALALLGPANRSVHTAYGNYSAALSLSLALAVWRVFPYLEKSAIDISLVRRMKWGTATVVFLTVAVQALPRRAIQENFEFGSFDGRQTYVIGKSKDELLLYARDEAARPRYRVKAGASNLSLMPGGRKLFEGLPTGP